MSPTLTAPQPKITHTFLPMILLLAELAACSGPENTPPPPTATGTPAAAEALGERLFLDTRFAQAFKVFLGNGGAINDPKAGDGVVNTLETLGAPIDPGPFKGMSMNCRACRFVDDVLSSPGGVANLCRLRAPKPDSGKNRW